MSPAARARRLLAGAAIVAVAVLAFSRAWHDGRTTLDGNGVVLYVDVALHYWRTLGHIPYWVPDMWAGTPVWALAPIFPVLVLLPAARLLGAEPAVRAMTILFQIIGGWGAMVLAASLWREEHRTRERRVDAVDVAAVVAGCLYALNPILISHGTLFGHETTIAVLGAAPWLAWSTRRALRGDGAVWIVVAGFTAAFAVLDQAEHAYALVIICALIALAQLVGAIRARGGEAARRVFLRVSGRAAGIVAVIAGLLAHWLVPLRALNGAYILSPPDVVSASLTNGIGAQVANEPGTFLTRGPGVAKVVTYQHPDLLRSGSFYLGWVWIAGAAITLAILAARPRRDRDATLSALLLASAVCVWMSTAATPLARSGPGLRHEWFALAVIGAIGGLCLGVYIRRLAAGRVAVGLAIAAVVLLFAVPYLTPFLVLQKLIPLAGNLRLPRLYPLAVLGLSLGAAYPITLLQRTFPSRLGLQHVRVGQVAAIAAAVGVLAVSIVDIWPYRTFYRTRPPADQAAYQAALASAPAGAGRLITEQFGDPRIVDELYRRGYTLATGWPHPVAGRGLWPLVVTPQEAAPAGYRDYAAALAGVDAQVIEHDVVPPNPTTAAEAAAQLRAVSNPSFPAPDLRPGQVEVDQNGVALPVVRAYDQAVVVEQASAAAELAIDLVPDHVSVVVGGPAQARQLGTVAAGGDAQAAPCSTGGAEDGGPVLGDQLAIACAFHRWVGKYVGLNQAYVGPGLGGIFSANDGLRGLSLWLLGSPKGVQLQIRSQQPSGALGPVIATVSPSRLDAEGMTPFFFPTPLPAGRYGFEARCPSCRPDGDASPRLVFTEGQPGDLLFANRLATDLVAGFVPIYNRPTPAPASTATVTTIDHRPGVWDIDVSADRPQLVVVSEAAFPGWKATVDGKGAPTMTADYAFVGVPVPAGTHRLRLRYRAPGVTLGDWLSILTVLACVAVVAGPRLAAFTGGWPHIRDGLRAVQRAGTRRRAR